MTGTELEKIIEEYGGTLSRFCYGLCKNEHDAQDLFQDTCEKLLKSKFSAGTPAQTRSFALSVCLNAYRDRYRARKRAAELFSGALPDEYFARIPEKAADKSEYDALYKAIGKLSYKHRAVIALCYLKDLTIQDAASVLKVPVGTVKSRLNKAKRLLREEMIKNEK